MYKLTGPDIHIAYRHAIPLRFELTPEWEKTPEDWQMICRIMAEHINTMLKCSDVEPETDKYVVVTPREKDSWH